MRMLNANSLHRYTESIHRYTVLLFTPCPNVHGTSEHGMSLKSQTIIRDMFVWLQTAFLQETCL